MCGYTCMGQVCRRVSYLAEMLMVFLGLETAMFCTDTSYFGMFRMNSFCISRVYTKASASATLTKIYIWIA